MCNVTGTLDKCTVPLRITSTGNYILETFTFLMDYNLILFRRFLLEFHSAHTVFGSWELSTVFFLILNRMYNVHIYFYCPFAWCPQNNSICTFYRRWALNYSLHWTKLQSASSLISVFSARPILKAICQILCGWTRIMGDIV